MIYGDVSLVGAADDHATVLNGRGDTVPSSPRIFKWVSVGDSIDFTDRYQVLMWTLTYGLLVSMAQT